MTDWLQDPLEGMDNLPPAGAEPVALPAVSLVVETRPEMMDRVRRITAWHRRWFRFAREVVVSCANPGIPGVAFVCCGTPPRKPDEFAFWYSDMCQRWLYKLCDAPFMLVWQWDGFVINPHLWSDDFLRWDYVGAPMFSEKMLQKMSFLERKTPGWKRPCDGPVVGNGGFSLRSRKFLEVAASVPMTGFFSGVEDFYLCVEKRSEMENAGIRFAPLDVARRFSRDDYRGTEYDDCLGFHDLRGHFAEVVVALRRNSCVSAPAPASP